MTSTTEGLSYRKGSMRLPEGRMVTAAIFACRECGAEHAERLMGNTNPEMLAKRLRREGWEGDHKRPSSVICPSCLASAAQRRAGEKPGTPPTNVHPIRPTPKEVTMTAPALPRDPTVQERLKIRMALDQHFDDEAGCYLNGWSDQRIGEDLKLPWAIVAKIREAAYGPIRVDPEIVALKAEAAKLQQQLLDGSKAVTEAQKGLDKLAAAIGDLTARVEALAKRRAA